MASPMQTYYKNLAETTMKNREKAHFLMSITFKKLKTAPKVRKKSHFGEYSVKKMCGFKLFA